MTLPYHTLYYKRGILFFRYFNKETILSYLFNIFLLFIIININSCHLCLNITQKCDYMENLNVMKNMTKYIIPDLCEKHKGEAGKVGVIGGSTEYTGAPYFAAITALKVGADLAFIITTESAAPIIKSYSPDLIVIPHTSTTKLYEILGRLHVVIIGPGLGRETNSLELVYDVIEMCKNLKKPIVIDADGLYAIYKNVTVLKGYPSPGAILTPNHSEARKLKNATQFENKLWYTFWGDYVSVLEKGEEDKFHTKLENLKWTLSKGGSCRRAGGQGDILAGALGTFLNWALKSNLCNSDKTVQISQSVAAYAAATLTRTCNANAFQKYGRSMVASDMLKFIGSTFESLFVLH